MASIQRRTRKDGSTAFRVVYRVDRRQQVKTFNTEAEAEAFALSLEGPPIRQVRVTALQVDAVEVTDRGGSASFRVAWDWVP